MRLPSMLSHVLTLCILWAHLTYNRLDLPSPANTDLSEARPSRLHTPPKQSCEDA